MKDVQEVITDEQCKQCFLCRSFMHVDDDDEYAVRVYVCDVFTKNDVARKTECININKSQYYKQNVTRFTLMEVS